MHNFSGIQSLTLMDDEFEECSNYAVIMYMGIHLFQWFINLPHPTR